MSRTPAPRLRHDLLLYDSEETLASAAVSFVREGLEVGENVLVSTYPLPVTALLRALFDREARVDFAPASHDRPVGVLDGYLRLLDRTLRAGATGVRAMGHIEFEGPLPWQEWVRYEAAINLFLADYPLRALCPYDTRGVAADHVRAVRRAHPRELATGGAAPVAEYVSPEKLVRMPEYAAGPDVVQERPPTLELTEVGDLRALRLDLYPALLPSKLSAQRVDDYVKAVAEVVSNALSHGDGPVRVRQWVTPRRLVCTVLDQGPGIGDPLAGYVRSALDPSRGGLGLWAARQLCDLLDYRATPDGFEVRLLSFAR